MESVGYKVSPVDTVNKALEALRQQPAFLVVIGVLNLPQVADAVIQALRGEASAPPILSLVKRPAGEVDYTLPAMAGPEELLFVIGEAFIRSHGHTAPADDCYMFVDQERCYIHVTDAAAELLGYRRGELLGRSIDDIAAPDMDVKERFDEYVRDGSQAGMFRLRRRNGELITIAYHAEVLADGCMVSHLFPTPVQSSPRPRERLLRKIRPI
jgi:PAS domain S-box-containing protein